MNGHLLRCAIVKPIGIHGPEREPAAFAAIGVPAQFAEIIGGNPLPFGDAGAFFGAIPVRVQQQGRGAVFRHRTVGVRGLDFFDAHGGRLQAGVGAREQAGFQGRDGIVLHMNDRAGRVFGRSRGLVSADGYDMRRGMGNRLTLCVAGHELEFAPGVAIVGPVHAVEVGAGDHVAFLQQPGLRTIGAAQPQATLAGAVQALVGGHMLQHHVVGQAACARTTAIVSPTSRLPNRRNLRCRMYLRRQYLQHRPRCRPPLRQRNQRNQQNQPNRRNRQSQQNPRCRQPLSNRMRQYRRLTCYPCRQSLLHRLRRPLWTWNRLHPCR